MLVSIVTATTGDPLLIENMESVQKQIHRNIEHLIFIDGRERHDAAMELVKNREPDKDDSIKTHIFSLPYVTGKNRFNGHKIYGASCFFMNGDYVMFLDEDNFLDEDHVSSLVAMVNEKKVDWGFSLRKIIDRDGNFLARDDCENLGKWPTYLNDDDHLVDVNCYFLRKDVAIRVSPLWYKPANMQVDRGLCRALLKQFPNCGTNGRYSLNYRVEATPFSVRTKFFHNGNSVMEERYPDGFPWRHGVEDTGTGGEPPVPERQEPAPRDGGDAHPGVPDGQQQTAPRDQVLAMAVRHFRADRLREAEKLCRNILRAKPNDFDALHLIAVVAAKRGQPKAAVDLIARAMALKPESEEARQTLHDVLKHKLTLDHQVYLPAAGTSAEKTGDTGVATFIFSSGRCGTQWLAKYLSENYADLSVIIHEPLYTYYLPRQLLGMEDLTKSDNWELILDHAGRIEQHLGTISYIECGWPCFAAVRYFAERFKGRIRVVHLTRHPVLTAASMVTHHYYQSDTRLDQLAETALLTPFDAGARFPGYRDRWDEYKPFEKCLYLWAEIHALGLHLEDTLDVPWLRLKYEDLFKEDGLDRFLGFLGLPRRDSMYAALDQWFDAYSYKTTRSLDVDAYARHPSVVSVARELGYEALDMDEKKIRQRYEHAPP